MFDFRFSELRLVITQCLQTSFVRSILKYSKLLLKLPQKKKNFKDSIAIENFLFWVFFFFDVGSIFSFSSERIAKKVEVPLTTSTSTMMYQNLCGFVFQVDMRPFF